jgi:hypothetical protein
MAASHINLIRNSKLYISTTNDTTAMKAANTYQLNVLDGFSFSQTTATAEISLSEAGADAKRGKKSFNTSRNPVDWSFTTYIRPYKRTAGTTPVSHSSAVEKLMWESLLTAGQTVATPSNTSWTPFYTLEGTGSTGMTMNTLNSDKDILTTLYVFFELSDGSNKTYYRINKALVNTAEIDFSIDGIAQIAWAGQGETLEEITLSDMPPSTAGKVMPVHNGVGSTTLSGTHGVGLAGDSATQKVFEPEYIRNKLSTVTLVDANGGAKDGEFYQIILTGGSVSIDNGVTYLTPDELGVVNTPIGGFTGVRNITGTMTTYLRSGGTGPDHDGSTAAKGYDSATLISDLLASTTSTSNEYVLNLNMGGAAAPMVNFKFNHANLEVPSIDVADVISTTINFTAEGASMTAADVMEVKYLATV